MGSPDVNSDETLDGHSMEKVAIQGEGETPVVTNAENLSESGVLPDESKASVLLPDHTEIEDFQPEKNVPLEALSNVEMFMLKEWMGLKDRVEELEKKMDLLRTQMDKLLNGVETKIDIPSVRVITLKELEAFVIESIGIGNKSGYGVSKTFVKSYLHTEKGLNWTVHYQKRLNLVLRQLVEKNTLSVCPDAQLYRLT